MLTIADYLFIAAVMLPPLALAIGFLTLISPHMLAKAERAERTEGAEATNVITAKAH